MTAIERNVKQTQFRVGLNTWFRTLGWSLIFTAGVWILLVLVNRLFDLGWPMSVIAAGFAAVALVASVVWAYRCRADRIMAAAMLDEAAGLKERTSSSLFCEGLNDPFAQAAASDAEAMNQKVTARNFIRLVWPVSLSYAIGALLIATVVTFLPIGPLQRDTQAATGGSQALQDDLKRQEVKRVQRALDPLKKQLEKNPHLKNLKDKLKSLDDVPLDKLQTPQSVRKEFVKKIDKAADELRKEQDKAKYNQMKELKRMFKSLKATNQPKTPTEQLTQALAKGDFKAAQDAVKEMQEQLAKMKDKQDPDQMKQMQEQLKNLSEQLKQAAQQQEQQSKEQLKKEMQEAGVDQETAERSLEKLTKEDIQKALDQMKQNGASQQQMQEMQKKMQEMQQKMQSCQQCNQMSQSMQQACQQCQSGNSANAQQQLQQMADMLNSMEGMEQQMQELESTLSDLQQAKNELSQDGQQGQGQGEGEGEGEGSGEGMGQGEQGGQGQGGMGNQPGKGRGGFAEEERTDVRFKKERTPVNTTGGSIISKMFVDGEQVRGEAARDAVELITASEREATDAINKAKVPNQYKQVVKDYFSRIRQDFVKQAEAAAKDEGADQKTEDASSSGDSSASDSGESAE